MIWLTDYASCRARYPDAIKRMKRLFACWKELGGSDWHPKKMLWCVREVDELLPNKPPGSVQICLGLAKRTQRGEFTTCTLWSVHALIPESHLPKRELPNPLLRE